MAPMWRALAVTGLLLQATPAPSRPSVLTKPSEAPRNNVQVLFYDDAFLFESRTFGDRREPGSPEPALFVNSRDRNRWLQILAISTADAKLGRSWSEDPQVQRQVRVPFSWDFTSFAARPYIDLPLRTSGAVAFPDRVVYDADAGRYALHFFSSLGVTSAETVLYIARSDLVDAFAKR